MSGPTLQTRQCITIPSRSLMVLNAKATIDKHMEGGLHKVVPNFLLSDEYPELVLIPTAHNVEMTKIESIPYILLNLSEEAIFLKKRRKTWTFREGGHYNRRSHYRNHVTK